MGLTSRKKRPLGRSELQERDDRIFLVASEDRYAVEQYFNGLRFRRVHVVTLPTGEDNKSAPVHVVDRLKAEVFKLDLQKDDQLWFALDTDDRLDGGHMKSWIRALREAKQIEAKPAISNPCFEVWLLLHVAEDLSVLPAEPKAKDAEQALKKILPNGYNKTNIPCDEFSRELAQLATLRAEKIDPNPNESWPKSAGTHFYRLMKAIFESER